MKTHDLHKLFVDELADMYDSELQIIDSLPKLIKLASLKDLKDSLSKHLLETKNQAKRIKKIFTILGIPLNKKPCKAMQGIIHEAEEIIKNKPKSATLDAAIISAAQKVEHYEIASYGTLRSFANHLSLKGEIADLLQSNLNEEGTADKKLTKIADGTFFSSGVNSEAAKSQTASKRKPAASSSRTPKTASKAKTTTGRSTKARKASTATKDKTSPRTATKKTSTISKRSVKSPALSSRTRAKTTSTVTRARQPSALNHHASRSSSASKLKSLLSHGNKSSSKMKSGFAAGRK